MMFYLAASASEKIDRIIGDFGVEWPMLIAQAVNFTLVAFVIYKFGFKGILSTIKEREKQISDSLKHAETIKLELEAMEKKQDDTIKQATLEAKKTLNTAKEQAKSFADLQKEEARKEAEEIIAKARLSTEHEREQMLKEAKEEIASLVVLTTGKVLQKELNEEEKSRFSNAAADELKISH